MEFYFLLLLVVIMAGALASGFPVAFALPGAAIITVGLAALAGYVFTGDIVSYFSEGSGPHQWLSAGVTNFRGVYWEPERDTLIAIPLFIFMGIMLQRSRIAEELLVTMAQLFGPMPGGLGISVIVVGALLAATTGIVGATVVAMGLISLPAMLRNGYSHSLATGTISASGTLGQIIPPSIVLIILADQLASAADQAGATRKALYKASTGDFAMPSAFDVTSTSAGEMFLGALLPGLLLVGLYIAFVAIYAFISPKVAPPVPYDGKYDWGFAGRVVLALVPPLALIFIVLGSIITGIATVNQAGSIGAAGALIMAGYKLYEDGNRRYWPAILAIVSITTVITLTQYHPINIKNLTGEDDAFWLIVTMVGVAGIILSLLWSGIRVLRIGDTLRGVMIETAKTTSLVFIILLGAAMLTSAFRGFGGEELVKDFLNSLPGGFWGQFFIVMLVIFILGFFLDFIEIAVVVVPIVAPILLADPSANVTAVWLGVMIGLNIQTSFLTPPFGFALFYLRGVAPAVVKTLSMYKGVIAFIGLQIIALVIVAYNPKLVNYLPRRVSLTSETAPPPLNPKLQHCMEGHTFAKYNKQEATIKSAISKAKQLDLSILPAELKDNLTESFEKSENTFKLVSNIQGIEKTISEKAVNYKPLHVKVRELQQNVRKIDSQIKELKENIDRSEDQKYVSRLENEVKQLEADKKSILSQIPSNWKEENVAFSKLLKQEKIARFKYRRNVDDAYTPLKEILESINAYEELEAHKDKLAGIAEVINKNDHPKTAEHIANILSEFGKIPGVSKVRSAFYNVRKTIRGKTPDPAKALELHQQAMDKYNQELSWRQKANETILAELNSYNSQILETIGLRQQTKLPRNTALAITGCLSEHRELTLYF